MGDKPLKPGWQWVKFGDVVRLVTDHCDPEAEGIERFVGLEHIEPGDLRIRSWGHVAEGTTFTSRFRSGQVLFGKRRAYQRKIGIADFNGVCSGDIYIFESMNPQALLPELVPFLCQTEAFFQHAVGTSAGSLSPRTNWASIAGHELALPPPDEQRRMARLLVAARDCLEALRDSHEASLIVLQSYIDSAIGSSTVRTTTIQELVQLGVLEPPQDGNHGEKHPKASDYVTSGIPFLMAADIVDGTANLETCKHISEPLARNLRIGFAREGDILLTHKGTVGQVGVLRGLRTEFAMLTPQVTYYRVADRKALLPDFLEVALLSSFFQSQLLTHGRQSTRSYVGITQQRQLRIPFPVPKIQREVANMVQQMNASRRALRDRCEVAASNLALLRNEAFGGTRR